MAPTCYVRRKQRLPCSQLSTQAECTSQGLVSLSFGGGLTSAFFNMDWAKASEVMRIVASQFTTSNVKHRPRQALMTHNFKYSSTIRQNAETPTVRTFTIRKRTARIAVIRAARTCGSGIPDTTASTNSKRSFRRAGGCRPSPAVVCISVPREAANLAEQGCFQLLTTHNSTSSPVASHLPLPCTWLKSLHLLHLATHATAHERLLQNEPLLFHGSD